MKSHLIKILIIIISTVILEGCSHINTPKETNELSSQLKNDVFELKGTFYWNFKLMGATQESINTFYEDKIEYEMKGSIYSTRYTIKKLSYDNKEKRWIGEDENKNIYVLFFKNISDSTMVVYKKKCKANGLKEALDFDYPKSSTTKDHGWNTYSKKQKEIIDDAINFTGTYLSTNERLIINNDEIVLNKKKYRKLSYHKGERRWVGKLEGSDDYLQLFFKPFGKSFQNIYVNVQNYTDLKKTYKEKYNDKNDFKKFTKKQ